MSLFSKKFLFISVFLLSFSFSFARSKADAAKENPENNYVKLIHPREYVFDFCDAKDKIILKFDNSTGKLNCNVDFTDLVKNEMPRKGDKLTFKINGTASKDLLNVTALIYDLKKSINIGNKTPELLIRATQKNSEFSNSISVILTENAESSLILVLSSAVAETNKKTDKIEFKLKRVCESTNTKVEAEELKKAIKEKKYIIELSSNFNSNNQEDIKSEEPETLESEEETENENTEDSLQSAEEITKEEQTENNSESENVTQNEITESPEEKSEIISEDNTEEKLAEDTAQSNQNEESSVSEEIKVTEEKTELSIQENETEQKKEDIVIPEKQEIVKAEPIIKSEKNNEEPVKTISNQKIISDKELNELKSSVSRYKKEYLQDYAVTDKIVIDEPEEYNFNLIENPDETDSFGRTMLMDAAKAGNDWQIKNLIDSGANVNLKDKEGWTALMYAVRYQENLNCVELLINAGSDIKSVNNYGTSILKIASCYNNNPEIIKKLLSYYSTSEKEVLVSFVLLITENHTSEYLQLAKLKIFLDSSIPVNNFYNGKTPLMYAAEYGTTTKVIKLLLDYDAVTSMRSTENKTAFDYAKNNTNLKHDNIFWSLNKK